MSMARRSFLLGLLAAVACVQTHTASAQSFPRLGGYLIGVPQNYDQQESQIAKLGEEPWACTRAGKAARARHHNR